MIKNQTTTHTTMTDNDHDTSTSTSTSMMVEQRRALRMLGEQLWRVSRGETASYIVSGVEHLPRASRRVHDEEEEEDEDEDNDEDNEMVEGAAKQQHQQLVRAFFERTTPCECRIRDCSAVLRGFADIVQHEAVHGRVYSHMCVHEQCMVPFDKLGNAKRHMLTIHQRRKAHAQVNVTQTQTQTQTKTTTTEAMAALTTQTRNSTLLLSSGVHKGVPRCVGEGVGGRTTRSRRSRHSRHSSTQGVVRVSKPRRRGVKQSRRKCQQPGGPHGHVENKDREEQEQQQQQQHDADADADEEESEGRNVSMKRIRNHLSGLLPRRDQEAALRSILRTFPDVLSGTPPFADVLNVVSGGALYLHFARQARQQQRDEQQLV